MIAFRALRRMMLWADRLNDCWQGDWLGGFFLFLVGYLALLFWGAIL